MRLNKSAIQLIAALSLATGATSALAAAPTPVTVNGGTIKFTGSIQDSACSISTNYTNQPLQLGTFSTKDLTGTIGSTTQAKQLQIQLTGCDLGGTSTGGVVSGAFSKVSVGIDGTADSINPNLIAISGDGSQATATGVALQILGPDSQPVVPGTFSASQNLVSGSNTFNLFARYMSTTASPTPGAANGEITFKVKYE